MRAERERLHRARRRAGALGQEVAEARGVEQARHADHALGREAEGVLGERRHLVERVRDDDDHGVGCRRAQLAADLGDDAAVALEQVGAALPGLARAARGDHDDVGAARLVVALAARERRVRAEQRQRGADVERHRARQVAGDVDQRDVVAEARLGDPRRGGGADHAGADDRDARHP